MAQRTEHKGSQTSSERDDHILDNVDLKGQWSIDFLMNSNIKAWLIDMAVAQQSAYWQYERAGMS